MAFLLGNLADAAARHWKRSLVFVVVGLAAIAGLTTVGTGFSDDFNYAGHRFAAGLRPALRALPSPVG